LSVELYRRPNNGRQMRGLALRARRARSRRPIAKRVALSAISPTLPSLGTELRRVPASQLPDPSRGSALVAPKGTAQWDPGNAHCHDCTRAADDSRRRRSAARARSRHQLPAERGCTAVRRRGKHVVGAPPKRPGETWTQIWTQMKAWRSRARPETWRGCSVVTASD
jgi:hypothetical protein